MAYWAVATGALGTQRSCNCAKHRTHGSSGWSPTLECQAYFCAEGAGSQRFENDGYTFPARATREHWTAERSPIAIGTTFHLDLRGINGDAVFAQCGLRPERPIPVHSPIPA
jgi:hypothetical protein